MCRLSQYQSNTVNSHYIEVSWTKINISTYFATIYAWINYIEVFSTFIFMASVIKVNVVIYTTYTGLKYYRTDHT